MLLVIIQKSFTIFFFYDIILYKIGIKSGVHFMKASINIKIKIFLMIFLSLMVMVLPFFIYFYILQDISVGDIILHLTATATLVFHVALIVNEYIFKRIFYSILKGRIIKSRYYSKSYVPFYLYLFLLFFIWIYSFITNDPILVHCSYLLFIFAQFYLNQFYLIADGYLIAGFRIIPLDMIKWYAVSTSKKSPTITIRYSSNRSCKLNNDPDCINELVTCLQQQRIKRKAAVS